MTNASSTVAAVMTALGASQPVALATDTKSFKGGFLLYRKNGGGMVKPGHKSQARNPRFRHASFAAAETEAKRLLPHHPGSTFLIMQEVARVKVSAVARSKAEWEAAQSEGFEVPGSEHVVVTCDGCGKLVDASTTHRWADDAETCVNCSPATGVQHD